MARSLIPPERKVENRFSFLSAAEKSYRAGSKGFWECVSGKKNPVSDCIMRYLDN